MSVDGRWGRDANKVGFFHRHRMSVDGRWGRDANKVGFFLYIYLFMDVESVALHEIGHLLGLGHTSVREAIMFPSISAGVSKGLHADDIKGIKALNKA